MTPEPDFVTINPAVAHEKFNVVIMRWARGDEYQVFRCSEALPKLAAEALARSWSAALGGLEIR